MTIENATAMMSSAREPRPHDGNRAAWMMATSLFVAAIAVNGAVFFGTWRTLLDTWINIDTYEYGLIVPLISIFCSSGSVST